MLRRTRSASTDRPVAVRQPLDRTALSTKTRRSARPATTAELRWALRALCLTEIVSWGVLYYAFPVLADTISTQQGWSQPVITAAFSAGLVVSAVAGIPAGRIIQRHGPRWLMTLASALGVLSVLVIAAAPNLVVFFAGWLLAGFAMSGVLYAPAFAAVTVWFGADRVRALTAITLIAGLASTVFAPLTAALNDWLGWRGTYVALAVALGVITIPAHYVALRLPWPRLAQTTSPLDGNRTERDHSVEDRVVEKSTMTLLTVAFTVSTVGVFAAVVNLVPLMAERGVSATSAAVVLGIGGVGQVAGRLGYARFARRVTLRARTTTVLLACAVATGLFGLVPGPLWLLIVVSVLAGSARGIFTLVQATAISDRWGAERYARLNGLFSAPIMTASALAPFIGSGSALVLGGYSAAFVALSLAGLAAAALAFLAPSIPGASSRGDHGQADSSEDDPRGQVEERSSR